MARTKQTNNGPVEIDGIENATFERDGDELVIRVNLRKADSKISESGKMRMFTTCRPFSSINDVPGCENMTVNLLVGRNMKFENAKKAEREERPVARNAKPAAKKTTAKASKKNDEADADHDVEDNNDENDNTTGDANDLSNKRRTAKPAAKKATAKKSGNARDKNRAERKRAR